MPTTSQWVGYALSDSPVPTPTSSTRAPGWMCSDLMTLAIRGKKMR